MTKLIIQIPCYNEEGTLGIALEALPKTLPGITIEWLIIDDGSIDKTVEVAQKHGVNHVVSLGTNKGLAKGFMAGIEACLAFGADIIVNTDADNQYCAEDIPKLIEPILKQQADIVIGERPIMNTAHFSFTKKILQKIGSFAARRFSNTNVADAPSGFRAYSKEAALRLNVFNEFTYTIETIIQAGRQGLRVKSVPIRTNGDLRPSRLVKSIPNYVKQNLIVMFRAYNTYKPMQFFLRIASVPFLLGTLLCLRWVVLFMGKPASHLPSLIVATALVVVGVQLALFGFLADLTAVNRKLLEDIQYRLRKNNR